MAKAPQRDQYGTSKKKQGNQIIEKDSVIFYRFFFKKQPMGGCSQETAGGTSLTL